MAERLPIIYVRGFGGGQRGIDSLVDDPFYGFNVGSTHVRVGPKGAPRFHQFEGPLLRLMNEDRYNLAVGGNQQQLLLDAGAGELAPDSLWVYRFYDRNSSTFGEEPEPYEIARAAQGLADFIALVREKTAGAPMVNLVAHSMGGLICRAAIQKHLDDPASVVSKLCTIGTPHGGIDPKLGGGIGDWVIKTFGPAGSDIFAPEVMAGYMVPESELSDAKPAEDWDPRTMLNGFPTDRVLSIAGTNARDYEVALGLSAKAMGEQSDGLVAIRNAVVLGSARAYVHRSHSGRYGLVNSEEVYQNLKRFLLGSLRVDFHLAGLDPARLTADDDRTWQADVKLAIRELPVLVHEQTAAHHCPVDLEKLTEAETPLLTVFLAPGSKSTIRYALNLRLASLVARGGWFNFGDHLEQIADWDDSLLVELEIKPVGDPEAGNVVGGACAWNSELAGPVRSSTLAPNVMEWTGGSENGWSGVVQLPETARTLLGPDAHLRFDARLW
ncbi:hypothetical protein CLV56_1393 [Mumia flava]|uniref:PGAP1-like protein n=1 Tax=Mumia flava TaxID=1348852 RepID=A0A0B2BP13_9ACTN|nr:hypothetical protein [Mumia flava]PJJ57171.1 hypothetical protein CLV56_1393 [Mumia flava]